MSRSANIGLRLKGILLIIFVFISRINAGEISISWQENLENDIAGYKIYYGTASNKYPNVIDVKNSTWYKVTNLQDGVKYFFSVTAYDTASNESEYSDEVSVTIPGGNPVDNTPPAAPVIAEHELQDLKINIKWMPNTEDDLKGYIVHYGNSPQSYDNNIDVGITTNYLTPNLIAGQTYYFAVSAYDTADNSSEKSTERSVYIANDITAPSIPNISYCQAQDLKITLKWQANTESDLDGYVVHYGTSSREYAHDIEVGNVTSFTTPELVIGQTYFFAISAYDESGNESGLSDEESLTLDISNNEPPAAPEIISFFPEDSVVKIEWMENTEEDLAGYRVHYGFSSRNYIENKNVGKVTKYTVTDLEEGKTYYFALSAYDYAGKQSGYSNEFKVITVKDTIKPPSPVISNIELDQQKVKLSWDKVNVQDLQGYNIYYGTEPGMYNVTEDVGNSTNYTTPSLVEGVTYYFAVTAYDKMYNKSDFSTERSIKIENIDITPPAIYSVEIENSETLKMIFSEPVEQGSAETVANYTVNNGVVIHSVTMTNDSTVKIQTSSHISGITYIITVKEIKDLADNPNVIAANSSRTYQYNPEDKTSPQITEIEVLDEIHVKIEFSEQIDRLSAENLDNYAIDNGIMIEYIFLDDNLKNVYLTTTNHQHNVEYEITVNNIKDRAPQPNIISPNTKKSYIYYVEDNVSPQIYSTTIKSATQVDVTFTEPVSKESAETITNYQIDGGINVLSAELDATNLQIIHLTTSPHQAGLTYMLTVNDVTDLAVPPNMISSGNTESYTYLPEDKTAPKVIYAKSIDASHVNITFDEDVERVSAENEENYSINLGIEVIEAVLDENRRVVHLITSTHESGNTYSVSVRNIKDRAPEANIIIPRTIHYTYLLQDTTPPQIQEVIVISDTQLEVVFSEIVEDTTSETASNYKINNGIQVYYAELTGSLKSVILETSTHEIAGSYILTVNNVKDRSDSPNVIAENSTYQYFFESETNPYNLLVKNIDRTGYQVCALDVNDSYYVDRSYRITSIPEELKYGTWIKTANEDRGNNKDEFLSFELEKDSKIYVGYDNRATDYPNWLKEKFTKTNKHIGVSEYAEKLSVWEKESLKSKVTLGGNMAQGAKGAESMYVVLIKENEKAQPPGLEDTNDPDSFGPPDSYMLYQNYPNPFNAGTDIRFEIPENCHVTLAIYNIIGQEVIRLVSGYKQAKHHFLSWSGKNKHGHTVPSGVYFARMEVIKKVNLNGQQKNQVIYNKVRKMMLLK